ncbi:MAG: tyrosine-type recombinase/integrase [Candidatus Babeliales bacterium]
MQQQFTHTQLDVLATCEPFLASQDIAATSLITYKHVLTQFALWCKDKKITTPTRMTILEYKAFLESRRLSAFTKSLYIVLVRRFFSWTHENNMYPDVAHGIKTARTKQKSHHKDSLSIADIKTLLAHIDQGTLQGLRDYALINMLVRTGLRIKEVASCEFSDIESHHGSYRLWIQGKGRHGKDEFVILTQATLAPLQAYIAARNLKQNARAPLFASVSDKNFGKKLTTFSISRLIRQYYQKAGIKTKRVTAHSLRHTFGVLSMQAGASLHEVQLAMRHTAPSTTQIYLGDIERIKRLEGAPEHKLSQLLDT